MGSHNDSTWKTVLRRTHGAAPGAGRRRVEPPQVQALLEMALQGLTHRHSQPRSYRSRLCCKGVGCATGFSWRGSAWGRSVGGGPGVVLPNGRGQWKSSRGLSPGSPLGLSPRMSPRPAALVAQGIEHRFPKPCVAGSNPAGGAIASQRLDEPGAASGIARSHQSESPTGPRRGLISLAARSPGCMPGQPSREVELLVHGVGLRETSAPSAK